MTTDLLPDIQQAIYQRLAAFPEFGGLAMILQQEGSIESRIDTALATISDGHQAGAALLIATPAANETGANAPIVRLDPLGITITAIEDTTLNETPEGTGRRALEWAVLVLRVLKQWTPPRCTRPLTAWGSAITLAPTRGSRVMVNVALRTKLELPLLRLPGEYGYVTPNPPPARPD